MVSRTLVDVCQHFLVVDVVDFGLVDVLLIESSDDSESTESLSPVTRNLLFSLFLDTDSLLSCLESPTLDPFKPD
jgi:hypothetical protein